MKDLVIVWSLDMAIEVSFEVNEYGVELFLQRLPFLPDDVLELFLSVTDEQ